MRRRLRLLHPPLLALLLSACAAAPVTVEAPVTPAAPATPAQPPVAAAEPTALSEPLPFDPAVLHGQLENGLTYYVRRNAKPEERAELWLVVDAGSIQEEESQRGLAHFVEHMAFNGTEGFAKQELVDYLERIGMRFGPDVNAFTSFDETVYTLRVPTDDRETLAQGLRILVEWAHRVSFDEEEVEKERGVMVEEWRLGRGAGARLRDRQFPVLFRGSRYAERLPIGRREVLETAPAAELRRFHRDWYRPDLMAVVAVGDFDPHDMVRRVEERFGGLRRDASPRPRRLYPVPEHREQLYSIETDPETSSTRAAVYYKLDKRPRGTLAAYRHGLAESLYQQMLNMRLDELRRRADPPFLAASTSTASLVRTRDVYVQSVAAEEGGVERALEALLTEVQRVDRHGFTAGELERAKADMLRAYERGFAERDKRDSGSYAAEYLRHFLDGEPSPGIEEELRWVRELLPGISLEELNRLAESWITEENRVVLVSAPESQAESLPSEAELAELLQGVERLELEPYADRTLDAPLVADPPVPARVVERREIAEIGVTEWRLDNGARVVLKPTDLRNDQVLLGAFSPGGHSLVTDADFPSATFADSIVDEGGLGDFGRDELRKALAGKAAAASTFIGELGEGASGSAAPEDLETMFQLVYLAFTAPRADAEAFAGLMARLRAQLENRLARPESVFRDAIARALYGDHPRRQPPSPELLDRVDLERALAVYRDRFADAGDFTFILVGNFEPGAVEPLVRTYLGGLPATGRQESWRDLGIEIPRGVQRVEVRKGLEPKSRVQVIFDGPAEWSRESLHDIASLASALRIRLREQLREEIGGTYGVRVGGTIRARPQPRYAFDIGFGCDPDNVEELVAILLAELETVRRDGLDGSYAEKVRQSQRRQRETSLQENGFWLGVLRTYYDHGWDPRLIQEHEALIARVTPERLQRSAESYLDLDNYLLAILYPEDGGG